MTNISAIDVNRVLNSKAATYNAVKIQVNEPSTNVSEGYVSNPNDNNIYNAVSIEVNKPSVNAGQKCEHQNHKCLYDYPNCECAVTSNFVPIHPVNVPNLPILPLAYQTTNFVNNRTLINAELEIENKPAKNEIQNKTLPEAEVVVVEETIVVPEPNVTTTEEQKAKEPAFHGINFKANEAIQNLEIVPPEEVKPDVDIPQVLLNLSSANYDVQAQQMEEIARISMEDAQKAVPYIVTEVFTELVNIVNKDTSELVPPSDRQIELRKQIIINEIVKEQAIANKQDPTKIELPYKLTEKDLQEASNLSSMEQAERNKEYALYTMAILAKVYTDEVERHTGNVVPLTDSPGVSTVVDTLRNNKNSGVKIAAIDALRYIYRPEYKEEITEVLNLVANDSNPYVSRNAIITLENLDR